ncbi:MAG: Gfo/Idh/MocA family oxidoreductase [Clostridia bacterium]|nr:Gfo/Idh/MocA family oxidoreductase [Clostridia bacterium]
METFKRVKVAVAGFKSSHVLEMFNIIKTSPYYDLVAISFDKEAKERIEKSYHDEKYFDEYPYYYSDEEMFENHSEIELCICGAENSEHFKQYKLCAKCGINVIMMKIPTLDMEEYDEMLRLEKETGIKIYIELEMRWFAAVERIKEIIYSGELGEITSITAYNYSHFPMWWLPWMNIPEKSYGKRLQLYPNAEKFRGGALTDHPHVFDLIRYITDSEFDSVYAETAPSMREEALVEDLVYVIGKLKNGTIISLDPSFANREIKQFNLDSNKDRLSHYPKAVQVGLSVCGTKGSLISDLYNPNTTEQLRFEDFEYRVNSRFYDLLNPRVSFMESVAKNLRNIKQEDLWISLEKHKKTMQVINACYESIYKGERVKI